MIARSEEFIVIDGCGLALVQEVIGGGKVIEIGSCGDQLSSVTITAKELYKVDSILPIIQEQLASLWKSPQWVGTFILRV